MYNSHQIANYFIRKSHATGIELTPMKLIKLCYIAHGWHLGLYDKELLDEAIYAWKFGPVIRTIYHDFKKYGNSQISKLYSDGENNYPLPDKEIEEFLDTVWASYGKYDGVHLSALTHQENTPWDIAWNKEGGKEKKDAIIGNDLIAKHYKEKIAAINAKRRAAEKPETAP